MRLRALAILAALLASPALPVEAAPFNASIQRDSSLTPIGMGRYGPKKFYRNGKKWDTDAAIKSKCIHPTQKCPLRKS